MNVHMKYDLVLLTIGCKSIVTICAGVLGLLLFHGTVVASPQERGNGSHSFPGRHEPIESFICGTKFPARSL